MKDCKLSRRFFLRGAGASLALPWLEIMLPYNVAHANINGKPKRFLSMFFANGVVQASEPSNRNLNSWECLGNGTDWQLSPVLQDLASVKQHLTMVHGLRNDSLHYARKNMSTGIAHWLSATSFLTGQPYDFANRAKFISLFESGASLDQLYGQQTPCRLKTLTMGSQGVRTGGESARGLYNYFSHLSYRSQKEPERRLDSSKEVFDKVFGAYIPSPTSGNNQTYRKDLSKSILDFVLEDSIRLGRDLGSADKMRLDEYLTRVRELEKKVVAEDVEYEALCSIPDRSRFSENSPGDASLVHQRTLNMIDLAVLAFKCDITRSITFMLENAHTYFNLKYYQGVNAPSYSHHDASHFRVEDEANRIKAMNAANRWQAKMFATLIKKLEAEEEGGSTILDNSILLFGCGLGNGDKHWYEKLPIILAGKGGGTLNPDRLVRTNNSNQSDFLLTLSRKLDLNVNKIGFSKNIISNV